MTEQKNEKDVVKQESHDGIQEYDNKLPNWWLFTFYLTIAVAFVYWSRYYIFQTAPNQAQELATKMEAVQKYAAEHAPKTSLSNADLVAMVKDNSIVNKGATNFKTYCTPCHGQAGEGGIGPNLTDNYWIHGWQPENIAQTITNGVLEKGMTSWKGILSPTQIQEVTVYVLSLEGTKPKNAKAPQGEEKKNG